MSSGDVDQSHVRVQKGIKMLRIAFPCFCLVVAASLGACTKSSAPLGFGYGTGSTGQVSSSVRQGLTNDLKSRKKSYNKKDAAKKTAAVAKAPAKSAPIKTASKPKAKPVPVMAKNNAMAKTGVMAKKGAMAKDYAMAKTDVMSKKGAMAKKSAMAKKKPMAKADKLMAVKTVRQAKPVRTATLAPRRSGASASPVAKPAGSVRKIDVIAVRDMVNAYRKKKGLKPVALHPQLAKAAAKHSKDLANQDKISHFGSDGSNPWQRVERTGYKPKLAAENVGTGQRSFQEVLKGWKESPSHNENLLLADANHMGIALVNDPKSSNKTFWTLVLGASL